ncbi:MAG: DnaJ domain-containing protein [Bacteroidota bacterium]
MELLDKYYLILGINQNSTIDELKQAYREKAKIYHPDRNPSPNAHEQFIILTEAYEYLKELKANPNTSKSQRSKYYPKGSYDNKQNEAREKARAQAQQYARMRYQEFIKTEYYKNITSLNTIFDHFIYIIALGVVFFLPVFGYLISKWDGILIALIIVAATAPITLTYIKQMNFNFSSLGKSFYQIFKSNYFSLVIFSLINIFIFIRIGLQTMIPLFSLISVYILSSSAYMGFDIMFSKFSAQKKCRYYIAFCIIPLIINMLLLANYKFSNNPKSETYVFACDENTQKSTYIFLKDNKYSQYPGIRVFRDIDQMLYAEYINYTFEEGLFGIRVMKNYKFF